jgi:hypothetical protein
MVAMAALRRGHARVAGPRDIDRAVSIIMIMMMMTTKGPS